MDVLVRHSPTPPTLRALAMEGAAGTVAAAAMACPAAADSAELEGAKDFLRGELTVAIREELVPVVGRQLSSSPVAFGQKSREDPESRMDCDGGSQVKIDDKVHFKRGDKSAFFLSVFVRAAIVRNPSMHPCNMYSTYSTKTSSKTGYTIVGNLHGYLPPILSAVQEAEH